MSGPVDVLAVLDRAAGRLAEAKALTQGGFAVEMTEARAAVAEMIEAADGLLHYTQPHEMPAAFERLAVALAAASGIAHSDAALARVQVVSA